MAGEENDVLNEVMLSLLGKNPDKLSRLLDHRVGEYAALDFFVLKMIHTSVYSNGSEYKRKYRTVNVDRNVDYRGIEVPSTPYREDDGPKEVFNKMESIRDAISGSKMSDSERDLIFHHVICGEPISSHSSGRRAYKIYALAVKKLLELMA
jgi:hypothetical protein